MRQYGPATGCLRTVMGAESLNAETRTIETLMRSTASFQYLHVADYSYNSQVSDSCSYCSFAWEYAMLIGILEIDVSYFVLTAR